MSDLSISNDGGNVATACKLKIINKVSINKEINI